jgi:hypothetical protein
MSFTIGEKKHRKEIQKLSDKSMKNKIKKECLVNTYCYLKEGKTRQADEAVRVYKRLTEVKEVK